MEIVLLFQENKSMKVKIYLIFCLLISTAFTINAQEIVSPNKNIKVTVVSKKGLDEKSFGQVYFKILYKKNPNILK